MKGTNGSDIVLIGTGLPGGLQLTVEGQRVLDRTGRAYAVSASPGLARYLRSRRVKLIDLSGLIDGADSPGAGYAAVARELLEATNGERPVVVLMPGSPMFLNTISRVIVAEGRRHELRVEVLPSVSPLDATISYLGLDVSSFGLQVFTGDHIARQEVRLDPAVPLIVMELAGTGLNGAGADATDAIARFGPLVRSLARFYRPDHQATIVQAHGAPGRRAHATLPLGRFGEFLPHITPNSHLFIDRRVPQKEG